MFRLFVQYLQVNTFYTFEWDCVKFHSSDIRNTPMMEYSLYEILSVNFRYQAAQTPILKITVVLNRARNSILRYGGRNLRNLLRYGGRGPRHSIFRDGGRSLAVHLFELQVSDGL